MAKAFTPPHLSSRNRPGCRAGGKAAFHERRDHIEREADQPDCRARERAGSTACAMSSSNWRSNSSIAAISTIATAKPMKARCSSDSEQR
jgi:hypothetical protein